MTETMHYFAYGSNMNHQQMIRRCPNSVFVKRLYLQNHKLIYDGYATQRTGAVANIVEFSGSIVWGALFKIDVNDLKALDKYEDYPNSYLRKIIEVKDEENNNYQTITYYRTDQKEDEPHPDYRNCILQGAQDCALPDDYIKNNL